MRNILADILETRRDIRAMRQLEKARVTGIGYAAATFARHDMNVVQPDPNVVIDLREHFTKQPAEGKPTFRLEDVEPEVYIGWMLLREQMAQERVWITTADYPSYTTKPKPEPITVEVAKADVA